MLGVTRELTLTHKFIFFLEPTRRSSSSFSYAKRSNTQTTRHHSSRSTLHPPHSQNSLNQRLPRIYSKHPIQPNSWTLSNCTIRLAFVDATVTQTILRHASKQGHTLILQILLSVLRRASKNPSYSAIISGKEYRRLFKTLCRITYAQ